MANARATRPRPPAFSGSRRHFAAMLMTRRAGHARASASRQAHGKHTHVGLILRLPLARRHTFLDNTIDAVRALTYFDFDYFAS